jgi:hypothetical protein
MTKRLLTFELSNDGQELHVHGDAEGLESLAKAIDRAKAQANAGKPAHDHLMTEAWAGNELSGTTQGTDTRLINKVTLHAWPRKK